MPLRTAQLLDALKLLALLAMTVDHINAGLFGRSYDVMTLIGRIAFPVFVFAAAFGALRTRSPRRYLRRLLLCAVAAQPFFWLALGTPWWHLNTVFTLLLGVLTVLAWRAERYWLIPLLLVPALIVDYGAAGTAAVLAAALMLSDSRPLVFAGGLALLALSPLLWGVSMYLVVGLTTCAATYLLWAYARERTKPTGARYLFYVFYPLHLAILAGARQLVLW